MSTSKRKRGKKYFSAAEANATLPLLRSIVKDVTDLAVSLRDRRERITRLGGGDRGTLGDAYREELQTLQQDLDRAEDQMKEYVQELQALGVELKDYYTGLIDFPAWLNGHEVYLCWRLGEPAVAHWHELDAGFAGRQKLKAEQVHSSN
ncbi:MAG TPA: DUF2203 domain-containing protein [Gemmataceae bacterium]|nr:DUF2203 domain-containing protein [Gemmataceae bacterium]